MRVLKERRHSQETLHRSRNDRRAFPLVEPLSGNNGRHSTWNATSATNRTTTDPSNHNRERRMTMTDTIQSVGRRTITLALPRSVPALLSYAQGIVGRMTGNPTVVGSRKSERTWSGNPPASSGWRGRGRTVGAHPPGRWPCLHPGQQHGRRWPSSSSSWVLRMRRFRVISCFASSTQQINSLRAKGVMSLQTASAVEFAISASRRSTGSLCTTPPGTRLVVTEGSRSACGLRRSRDSIAARLAPPERILALQRRHRLHREAPIALRPGPIADCGGWA
jgi:hypothetical protein